MAADVRRKYPRTPHLPSSPGATADDKRITNIAARQLFSTEVVVTEKMDGGNVTLSRNYFHARSTNDTTPLWERHAKGAWAAIAHDIPRGWRVSAESLWARRSVPYTDLPGYLMVIGIWNGDTLLSWPETVEWATLLELPTVPFLGSAQSEAECLGIWSSRHSPDTSEGFVVRSRDAIPLSEFGMRVAKWVRPNHVRTSAAWRTSTTFPTNAISLVTQGV